MKDDTKNLYLRLNITQKNIASNSEFLNGLKCYAIIE